MRKTLKVTLDELTNISKSSDEQTSEVHHLIRRVTDQGLAEPVDLACITEISRLGVALSELALVLMYQYQLRLREESTS